MPLSQTTGAVVLGTGYHYRLPQFIKDIKQQIEFDDAGQLAVQRDYSIDIRGDIFCPKCGFAYPWGKLTGSWHGLLS